MQCINNKIILGDSFRGRYLLHNDSSYTIIITIIDDNNSVNVPNVPIIMALEFSGTLGLTRAQRLAESNGCVLSEMTKLLSPTLIPEELNNFRPL